MTRRRRELRAEETKGDILAAAGRLFAQRGYDAVTMREIAKEAGCSHTTIYIYFKNKEDLLHQLSREPLSGLYEQMAAELQKTAVAPEERLKSAVRVFIRFCLQNRNMYTIFFMAKASQMDEKAPELEVQMLRNRLFELLRQGIRECLGGEPDEERLLAFARIYFFTLHGIIGAYTASEEPLEALWERLSPTFDLATDVLAAGFRQTLKGA